MTKTEHYQLNQWEASDQVKRTDFNEDNAKIDAALDSLASRVEVVIGTYDGNGVNNRTIELGFTPKAVLLENASGQRSDGDRAWGGLMLPNCPIVAAVGMSAQIVEGGFQVHYASDYNCGNVPGIRYRYLAFK